MTTQQAISLMILKNIAEGMEVREAFDNVLGAGRYDEMASDAYDQLTAK